MINRGLPASTRLPSRVRRLPPAFVRAVRPEILDGLPEDSVAARASRRDLRIINRVLGTSTWFRHALRTHHRAGERVLELGAGSGDLCQTLSAITPDFAGIDRTRRPPTWPAAARWFETDVHEFTSWTDYPVVIANLLFHHFDSKGLARLGAHLGAHARVIISSDPRRTRRAEVLFGLLCPLIRAHPVTRYDGCISIAAGFRGKDLPHLLQLDPAVWRWHTREIWLGAYRFVAERRA